MVAGIIDDGGQEEEEEGVGVQHVLGGAGGVGEVEDRAHHNPHHYQQAWLREDGRQSVVEMKAWNRGSGTEQLWWRQWRQLVID